jgi:hypothetical protein
MSAKAKGEIQFTDAAGNVTGRLLPDGAVVPVDPRVEAVLDDLRNDTRLDPRPESFEGLVESLPEMTTGALATAEEAGYFDFQAGGPFPPPAEKPKRTRNEAIALMQQLSSLDNRIDKAEAKVTSLFAERETVRASLRAIFASDDGGQAKAVRE